MCVRLHHDGVLPKSNWSRAGGGGSLIAGGKVAGESLGNGHSNCISAVGGE